MKNSFEGVHFLVRIWTLLQTFPKDFAKLKLFGFIFWKYRNSVLLSPFSDLESTIIQQSIEKNQQPGGRRKSELDIKDVVFQNSYPLAPL